MKYVVDKKGILGSEKSQIIKFNCLDLTRH